MSDQATLVKSLIESGILSAEDATLFSRSDASPADGANRPQSESSESVLQKLEEHGRLSAFQIECIENDGPGGLLLGDYILIDRLGAGGMGEVYRAVHRIMRREVAIKRLKTSHLNVPGLATRFIREVRAAAKLVHPNIVTAYDAGEDASGCYLVMEYVQGKDLAELIREQGPLAPGRAAALLLEAARALDHAHQAGIIHRDIKPANFLIDEASGTLKLLDLGLARIEQTIAEADHGEQLTLTHADQIVGTLAYMAPEQADDPHAATVAADLYALGCTLYSMVTAEHPFASKNAAQAVIAHRELPAPDLSDRLPPAFDALYRALMAKDPGERPPSATVVVHTLEQLIASGLSSDDVPTLLASVPTARPSRKPKPQSTTPAARPKVFLWVGLGAAATAVVIGALFLSGVFSGNSTTDGTPAADAEPTSGSDTPVAAGALPTLLNTTAGATRLQTGQAAQLGEPIDLTNSVGMAFRYIPSGSYLRGSTPEQTRWVIQQATAEGLYDRYAQYIDSEHSDGWHTRAHIKTPFYIATTEVTVGQFRAFVEATGYKTLTETDGIGGINFTSGVSELDASWDNPGMEQDDSHPVINLTQPDCIAFCDWLSEKEGVTYRLPRESEWEFACRAGSLGRWCYGDEPSAFYQYGWCYYNSPNSTKPVGKLKPNAFGLYDMHGNAREWVLLDDGSPANEEGTGVVRGGSFTKPQVLLRSASRVGFKAKSPYPYHGFRVLREIELAESP